MTRPLIAVPARFSVTTSALRYAAEVNARALIEAVWRAGGEPVSIHPTDPADTAVAARLSRFDGVLLPGGGDIAPHRYGAADTHDSVYDVDDLQDAFDLEVARLALESGTRCWPSAAASRSSTSPSAAASTKTWAVPTTSTGIWCTR